MAVMQISVSLRNVPGSLLKLSRNGCPQLRGEVDGEQEHARGVGAR